MPDYPETASNTPAENPLLVEVTRGNMVESCHRASYAVCDSEGRVVLSAGQFERPVYGRSALKPLQAIPLVETGAAARWDLSDAEIAVACASHNGEPRHVQTVGAWLKRLGLSEADLECAAQLSDHGPTAAALLRSGETPNQLHNNCSGKHSGFLATARHLGHPTAGYIRYDHPIQQRILGVLEAMCGLDLSHAPRGIDGCGIPVIAIPLGNMAMAMARLVDPHDQPEARQAAAARITAAMAAEPFMVAGSDRFCTLVMEATAGKALIKTGAEGVYCGALPGLGLGIALKIDDGATRAAEVLMAQLLLRLEVLVEEALSRLPNTLSPVITNRAGVEVGQLRKAAGWRL